MKAMFRLPSSLFCFFFLCLSLSLVHHTCSSFIPTNASSSVHHSCSEDEHAALLALKHSFTLSDPHYPDEFINKTRSWKKGTDCCAWEGIRCHLVTHHVIVLDLSNNGLGEVIHSNSSLFKLHHLRSLNLSINWFSSRISSNFGQFQFLKHLDLSGNKFSGKVPSDLAHLSQLKFLDLSFNDEDIYMLDFNMIIDNLTNLRHLGLSEVSLDSKIPESISNLSSLTVLRLIGCNLVGELSVGVLNLPHLKYLDVGDNIGIGVSFIFSSPNNWSSPLEVLYLSNINISSTLPLSPGSLQHLKTLSLSNCSLHGTIPAWVWNISKAVDLSYNNLTGSLPHVTSKPSSLTYLWLGNNMLSGEMSPWLLSLKSLEEIWLNNNNFCDTISLYNTLSNLPKLQILYLSNSGLSVTITDGPTNSSSSSFPSSLQNLLLSNTNINGEVPKWFQQLANESLITLDISKNSLNGPVESLLGSNMQYIDISYNMLYGPLSFPFFPIQQFLASNNNITSSLDESICNLNSLEALDLSNNLFHGELPHCLGNICSDLQLLNLGGNNFQGTLSANFSNCNELIYLDLSSNGLEGLIPKSLTNCISLQLLNLRNNKFKDEFPYWLHTLPSIQVLLLSFNYFHGHISYIKEEHPFSMLRILDLSNNNFHGKISNFYIKNFRAMMNVSTDRRALSYMDYIDYVSNTCYYSINLDWKGLQRKYDKIITTLTLFDLSNNAFEGVIPKGVGQLVSLGALNLSHNMLTGFIPSSMGKLTSLEFLDLSSNILNGQIPQELTNVTFLNFFNVSENDLKGPIPQGNNFNTFSIDSYKGNPRLCGFPLPSCRPQSDPLLNTSPNDATRVVGGDLLEWKIIMMGWATGFVVGMAWGHYMLSTGKPFWFTKLAYAIELRVFEFVENLFGRRIRSATRRNNN